MTPPDKCPRCGADESASEYSKAYACGTLVSMSGTFYHTTTCQYFSELRKPLDIERDALAARVKELEERCAALEAAGSKLYEIVDENGTGEWDTWTEACLNWSAVIGAKKEKP